MKDPQKIHEMFESIAPGYDRANNILSFGVHRYWRKELANWILNTTRNLEISAERPLKLLDCATGTGDVAIEIKKLLKDTCQIQATDFSEKMLERAPQKAKKLNLDIDFSVADATKLPYADESFDVATISFGIRNVSDPEKAISEMVRVLKPKGQIFVLEFGQPRGPWFSKIYSLYSQQILPTVGSLVTGNRKAYRYLEESASEFPCRNAFLKLMQDAAPLQCLHFRPLSLGIAYIYRGIKVEMH